MASSRLLAHSESGLPTTRLHSRSCRDLGQACASAYSPAAFSMRGSESGRCTPGLESHAETDYESDEELEALLHAPALSGASAFLSAQAGARGGGSMGPSHSFGRACTPSPRSSLYGSNTEGAAADSSRSLLHSTSQDGRPGSASGTLDAAELELAPLLSGHGAPNNKQWQLLRPGVSAFSAQKTAPGKLPFERQRSKFSRDAETVSLLGLDVVTESCHEEGERRSLERRLSHRRSNSAV